MIELLECLCEDHHQTTASALFSVLFHLRLNPQALPLSLPVYRASAKLRIPTIATSHSDSSRPPIPIDRDRCGAGFLKAPLDNALHQCLARWANWSSTGEAVPVVNRRDLRATRRALVADAAARAGGAC